MGSGQDPAAPEVSRMAARVWLWGHQGVRMTVVKAAADLTELPYWCGHRATVLSGEAATRGSGGNPGLRLGRGSPVPGGIPAGWHHQGLSGGIPTAVPTL